ncbi:MAG: pentapeptide repeat-containing protein [Candidatus Paracaedimonas acanthamoebae]|uniref:Pentapeptide repeat-containing protein n=1 Tax=Candidatus Paracaedimonas acanthamoebae TaxID=244581 RepID=A0A8J7PIX9_9PROT|nr:pentapeptide repeat-containing protein [Candidatus Paracaedimonas acanthamoebae]
MKYILFLFFVIPLKLTYAFNREHLRNFHEQLESGQRISAVGFNLRRANLKGLDLKRADFSGANLRGADFSDADLTDAVFEGTILTKVNFQRANLTRVELKDAVLNGSHFKKARLLGIKYHKIRSAKGTLFEDKKEMQKKIAYEEKIERIEREFCEKKQSSIPIDVSSSAKKTHIYLNDLANNGKEYTLLDFRVPESFSQEISPLVFLKAPLFKSIVKSTLPIADNQGLIIFLENKDLMLPRWNPYHPSLDLHARVSLPLKYKWIEEFIRKSFYQHLHSVEIITGRGLHNPQGKMGTLWNICHDYLIRKKFSPYIQEIHSISKQGGWRVTLKNRKRILRNKKDNARNLSFYGPTASSGELKVQFMTQKDKRIRTPVENPKKTNKNQDGKGRKKRK